MSEVILQHSYKIVNPLFCLHLVTTHLVIARCASNSTDLLPFNGKSEIRNFCFMLDHRIILPSGG